MRKSSRQPNSRTSNQEEEGRDGRAEASSRLDVWDIKEQNSSSQALGNSFDIWASSNLEILPVTKHIQSMRKRAPTVVLELWRSRSFIGTACINSFREVGDR